MSNETIKNLRNALARYKRMNNAELAENKDNLIAKGFEIALKCFDAEINDEERRLEDEKNKHFYDTVITRGRYTVKISHKTNYGYWQRDGEAIGGLWLTDGILSDYDGCYELPTTVKKILITNFYIPKDEADNY